MDAPHLHASIENYCRKADVQQIVELVWACAILGLYDDGVIEAIRARAVGLPRTREENAKIDWAFRRLNTQWLLNPDEELLKALDEEHGPEKGPKNRERAAEALMRFVAIVEPKLAPILLITRSPME